MLSAAYRWGFVGTVATTAVTVVVFLLETVIAAIGPWPSTWLASIDFELNRTILRVAYLSLTGFLLGYLAEQDKRLRSELAAIADVMRQPQVHLGLGGSVAAVTRSLFRTLDASVVHFVLQDRQTKNTYRWRVDRAAADDRTELPRVEVDVGEQDDWLFSDVGRVWEGARSSNEASVLRARVVDVGTWPLRRTMVQLPEGFAERHEFTRVVVANLGLADEWVGRIYVFDPSFTMNVEQALHFVDALVEHVTPALSNVFLVGRLRTRATESERARVARELHDGAIQALFGVEMKVHALRRRADTDPAATEAELRGNPGTASPGSPGSS